MAKTKVIFLGTNGWFDSQTGDTTCILIDAPEGYVFLDAGNGIYKADKYIKEDKPVFLFLSHFHLDHIIGLHILNKFRFSQGLTICCYEGGQQFLRTILNQPFTIPYEKLPFKLCFRGLSVGLNKNFPFEVKCAEGVHSTKCFSYRLELKDSVISYCPDTGLNEAIQNLTNQADLLIAECTWLPGQTKGLWPHLNPEQAAELAKKARVKQLALVHFDADNYKTVASRIKAERVAQQIFQNTHAMKDEMVIKL